MVKSIIGVVVGVILGGFVVAIVEGLGSVIHPAPALDPNDAAAIARYMQSVPVTVLFTVVLGWMLGAFTGGFVTSFIARREARRPALVTGGIFVLLTIATLVQFPHPVWMWVAGILLPLPMAWLGEQLRLKLSGNGALTAE